MEEQLVPEIEIKVDGQKLSKEYIGRLLSARVSYSLDKSDMFQLVFNDSDFAVQEKKIFDAGKEVIVSLGYSQKFTKMIEGEVVKMDYDFETLVPTKLTITGFDKMFRLNRTKHSRSFLKMKDSDIAQKIASEMGLKPDIKATSQKHEYIFQNNQSNLKFLKERAKRIDYEVEVEEGNLVFKPARHEKRENTVKLMWDRTLMEFHTKIDATKVVDEVEVTGWDPKTKKMIKGTSKAGGEKKSISGQSGAADVKGKFSNSSSKSFKVDAPITTQEEADNIAKARLNQINMEYMTGYGVAQGEPKIQAGKMIEIGGLSKVLNGDYYISGCEHLYNQHGYKTFFDVKRSVHGQ
jgi:phage protein D